MPKRRRGNRSDNEVETATFSMPEDKLDNTPSSNNMITPMPQATTTFSLPFPEQVFNISEWTIETDRVSTSNTLFASMVDPASNTSFSKSDHNLHIPGAYHNYDVDVSDFQPPPEPLQSSGSANTESSRNSKERLFVSFSLISI